MNTVRELVRSAAAAVAGFLGGFVGVRGAGAIGSGSPARCDSVHDHPDRHPSDHDLAARSPWPTTPEQVRLELIARASQRRSCC